MASPRTSESSMGIKRRDAEIAEFYGHEISQIWLTIRLNRHSNLESLNLFILSLCVLRASAFYSSSVIPP